MSLAAASLMRADGADPGAAALAAERQRALESRVARLDAGRRELLALRFGAGLTSREIAAVVSKSEASVKKQLTRTISALKELYHDELP